VIDAAEIAALADVYDALTTQRPYKEAFSHEKAQSIILSTGGKQFDPDAVEAFVAREEKLVCLSRELADDANDRVKSAASQLPHRMACIERVLLH
jgi:HD-GYP domain-containing protein (c-di-GMP phosphodiesterase class II)